jgi:hypothetical protein
MLPGLSEADFKLLFWKCRPCGLVMTRRVCKQHACPARKSPRIIIDLTCIPSRTIIDLTSDPDEE